MEVDVQRPQVAPKLTRKVTHDVCPRVAAKRSAVLPKVICLVGVAPVYKSSSVYTQINPLWYICS
jgi:hypothetical protein